MSASSDLLQAKQALSARLLRKGLQGGVVSKARTRSITAAVASAGRSVHAVGVGPKIVNGKPTDQLAVCIYVIQKLADSLLPPRDRLPEFIDGIPTDIIESPPAFLLARASPAPATAATACADERRSRQRPLVAGISASHYDLTAGTISYFCRSTRHGDDPNSVFALSNSHVFARVNVAQPNDDLYQPGPDDGGTIEDHFAELHRFTRLTLGGIVPNRVDAAIGRLLPEVDYNLEICGIGRIAGTAAATIGMTVQKHGRSTGYTEGVAQSLSYDATVGLDRSDPNLVALFQDQIRIERLAAFASFGLDGDSGALVVDKASSRAVGLFCAGPESGEYGVANHIEDVLSELQIELL